MCVSGKGDRVSWLPAQENDLEVRLPEVLQGAAACMSRESPSGIAVWGLICRFNGTFSVAKLHFFCP